MGSNGNFFFFYCCCNKQLKHRFHTSQFLIATTRYKIVQVRIWKVSSSTTCNIQGIEDTNSLQSKQNFSRVLTCFGNSLCNSFFFPISKSINSKPGATVQPTKEYSPNDVLANQSPAGTTCCRCCCCWCCCFPSSTSRWIILFWPIMISFNVPDDEICSRRRRGSPI